MIAKMVKINLHHGVTLEIGLFAQHIYSAECLIEPNVSISQIRNKKTKKNDSAKSVEAS